MLEQHIGKNPHFMLIYACWGATNSRNFWEVEMAPAFVGADTHNANSATGRGPAPKILQP